MYETVLFHSLMWFWSEFVTQFDFISPELADLLLWVLVSIDYSAVRDAG